MINCPCGYGNNLPDDTEKCSVCSMNLMPISKLKLLYKKYYDNALLLYQNNKPDEAIEQIMISLNFKNDFIPAYHLLSEIYEKKREYSKSFNALQKAFLFNPKNEKILNSIEMVQKKIKKKEMFRCTRSIALDIIFPILFFTLAFIMFNTDLREYTQNAITQNPQTQKEPPNMIKQEKILFFIYTIQKNETLGEISRKFFGNTNASDKIYIINKNVLKDKNKIHTGIKIKIPVE
jgi:tetratricopeptide (TPR) repeat protein